jgi:hypothetical protein
MLYALAIVSLYRHAFPLRSLSAPMDAVLSGYGAIMRALLGWIERPLQEMLTWVGGSIEWRPRLHPHWRDMLVVVAVWNGALMWERWRVFAGQWVGSRHADMLGFDSIVALSFACFVLAVGGLLMAAITGMLPLHAYDLTAQLAIAVAPWIVLGVALLLGGIMPRNGALVFLVLAGVAALMTWWLSQAIGSIGGTGVVGFAGSVIVASSLLVAAALALSNRKPFLESRGVLGLYILSGFIIAGVLLAIDAGLKRLFG